MLQEYNCENKKQLEKRERYYIELLKSSLNGIIPTRTSEEWRLENKDKKIEYDKQYREENKDKILKYQTEYKLENKDKLTEQKKQKVICNICNSEVSRNHLARHKKSLKCIKFQELIESK